MCETEVGSRKAYKTVTLIFLSRLEEELYLANNRTTPGQGLQKSFGSCFVTLDIIVITGRKYLQVLSPERTQPQQGLRGPTAIHHYRPNRPCSEISGGSRGCCFVQGFNFVFTGEGNLTN